MGWLRDLMSSANPPVRSYGVLARQVLAAPDWPDISRPQPRSLAALFSKFDRNQELDWLTERPQVQMVLAEALGRPLAEVASRLEPGSAARAHKARSEAVFRLVDVPYARPIDLTRESPCPGLPVELLRPSLWQRTWWYAPPGAARPLVEAWLEQRGLCHVVRANTLEDAASRLPAQGVSLLFIEHPGAAHVPELSTKLDLCVVAPFLPEQLREPAGSDVSSREVLPWRVIRSPPPETYLEELVHWVFDRLPDDGNLEAVEAIAWLKGAIERPDGPRSLESLLGLCGALDEIDKRELGQASASMEGLSELYFRNRLSQVQATDTTALAWLRREGSNVLIGVAGRLLMDADLDWHVPRSFDDWLKLVPIEYQRGGDLDWMRLALSSSDSPVRPGDIARAAKRIPPGAFRVVRALDQAQLLIKEPDGLLALRPHWFRVALVHRARRALLDASPLEWGEVLLNPREAPNMLGALLARAVDHDFGPMEAALELESEHDPASVAAIEASFATTGLALLSGADAPQDLLENLWNEQLGLTLQLDLGLPSTRLLFPEPDPERAPPRGWFTSHTFHLAALAISEQLPHGAQRRHALLRPWSEQEPPALLKELYDSIWLGICSDHLPPVVRAAALALVDRLRQTIGQLADPPHALEWPGVVLDEIEHEILTFQSVAESSAEPRAVEMLAALAREREVPWPEVGRAIWQAWNQQGRPEHGAALLAPDFEHAALFWSTIPKALLTELLQDPRAAQVPYQHFSLEQWSAFVETAERSVLFVKDVSAFAIMPERVARECLTRVAVSLHRSALTRLWERFSDLLLERLRLSLEQRKLEEAFQLMAPAPATHTAQIAGWLRQHLNLFELGPSLMNTLRSFLAQRSAVREDGWREAYALLCDVEDTVAPVQGAQP